MLKKSFILGLLLLLAGVAVLGRVLAEQRKERQLLQQHQERYQARLDKLDKLAAGETDVDPFAGIVRGENLQQELDEHSAPKHTRELNLTLSIVCIATGGTICTWWLLLWTARLMIKVFSGIAKYFTGIFRRLRKNRDKQQVKAEPKEAEKTSQRQKPYKRQSRLKKRSEAFIDSGWRSLHTNFANPSAPRPSPTELLMGNEPYFNSPARNAEKVAVLLCDEDSTESAGLSKTDTEDSNVIPRQLKKSAPIVNKTVLPQSHESSIKLEESLKTQTENLEKQVTEFRQMAQTVQQTTLEHSKPLNNTLKELTEQVAAIREYAAEQQQRVTKLQEGYDWNIIRNFCLRVIHCIDNLESRINRLSERNIEAETPLSGSANGENGVLGVSNDSQGIRATTGLEAVRDELIFALESSGVEQFKPEINSDYRGQEKRVEVVKDKEFTNEANLTGKIARVVRPGYQYVIDEENVKVVRAAQVKLFG